MTNTRNTVKNMVIYKLFLWIRRQLLRLNWRKKFDNDPFEECRKRIQLKLKDFSSNVPDGLDFWSFEEHQVDREQIPVAELVLITLSHFLGCPSSGPSEKSRWSVYCTYKGIPLAFTLRKFGFRFSYPPDSNLDSKRIFSLLSAALSILEKYLLPFAELQIHLGNFTVENQYHEFEAKYQFFRNKAEEAFTESQVRREEPKDVLNMATALNHIHQKEKEGFFYSSAMIDAFFSRLEHQLILLMAFSGNPVDEGMLLSFLKGNWSQKLKKIVDVSSHPYQKAYEGLKRVKERIRNPLSHGGFEKDKSSLYIHVPTIGAIPASFSQVKDSVSLNLFPIDENEHTIASSVFDEFDQLICSGGYRMAMRMIEAGIDPAFDPKSLKEYREAMGSEQELEDYIQQSSRAWEQHVNMDY